MAFQLIPMIASMVGKLGAGAAAKGAMGAAGAAAPITAIPAGIGPLASGVKAAAAGSSGAGAPIGKAVGAAGGGGGGGGMTSGLLNMIPGMKAVTGEFKTAKPIIAKAAGGIALLGGVAGLVILKFTKLNAKLVESQRSLTAYNGTIAASMAQLDADRHVRKIELGARTGAGTARVTEAQSRLEENTLPWEAAITNIQTYWAAFFTNMANGLIEQFNKLPVVGGILDYLDGEATNKSTGPFLEFLHEIANKEEGEKNRKFAKEADIGAGAGAAGGGGINWRQAGRMGMLGMLPGKLIP